MRPHSHDTVVTNQFGPQAEAYLASPVHAHGEDLQALRRIIGKRPTAHALDLGCGGGHVAYLLAELVGRVTAYDLSPAMLATVEAEAQRRGLHTLTTAHGTAEALPFPDASFDIVASRYSAHHWQHVREGVREARRVLKPGGLAVFMDVVAPESALLDTWLQTLELLRDPSHVRDYAIAEWESLLRDAGFMPNSVARYRLPLAFGPWIARIKTPDAHVHAIRSLQQGAGVEVSQYFALQADGSFTIDTMLMTATSPGEAG